MILETDKLSVILLCMIFFFWGGWGVEWGWGIYSEKLEKNTFNENKALKFGINHCIMYMIVY